MTSAPPPTEGDPTRDDATRAGSSSEAFKKRYFRSGLGLRREVRDEVGAEYRSGLVRRFREHEGTLDLEGLVFRLAAEFGFCYGVERAVDYAYETLRRFPGRRIVLTGEIIHNPDVNGRLRAHGIRFLGDADVPTVSTLGPDDVVVLPAFGVTAVLFEQLRAAGSVVVDTTCGSVLNVWKNVERYAREGRTSIVHGKAAHEETRATVSRATLTGGAPYIVVLDRDEASRVAAYVRAGPNRGDRNSFLTHFAETASPGFNPDRDLERVGMANQTTMLSGDSLEVARIVEAAFLDRFGAEEAQERFRSFDTICSATQERQDALKALIEEPLDLLLVIGGYNSSNTGHLLELAAGRANAYHINAPTCLVSETVIRHKPEGAGTEVETEVPDGWLPPTGGRIGLTAGASTPDSVIGAVVDRVLALHRAREGSSGS